MNKLTDELESIRARLSEIANRIEDIAEDCNYDVSCTGFDITMLDYTTCDVAESAEDLARAMGQCKALLNRE